MKYEEDTKNLKHALELIENFLVDEYSLNEDDILYLNIPENLNKINLAFTTDEDTGKEIQVDVNLLKFKITTYLNNKEYNIIQYRTLKELIENELESLDFDSLTRL